MSTDTTVPPSAESDHARVLFRPPMLLLASILLGLGLHQLLPVRFVPEVLAMPLGLGVVVVALVVFGSAIATMRRHEQSLPTYLPTTAIVRTGPYAFSRNPIYLAFCLLQLGIALWVNAVALLATTLVCAIVLNEGVVKREEAYLAEKFGPTYDGYRRMVRRWI